MTSRRKVKSLVPFERKAPETAKNAGLLMVERLLKGMLEAAVTMLKANPTEATRYFSHFFDTSVSTTERDQFVEAFLRTPPKVILGYARAGVELPCFAVVLESEQEAEAFLGDYAGTEGQFEYLGADFDATISIFVYAAHATMAPVLYQLAKAIVHAGKGFLLAEGVLNVQLSGGELAPDENYMPELMYVRALRVNVKYPYTSPELLPADPTKLRLLVFACDINVDGIQGGVHFTHTVGDE